MDKESLRKQKLKELLIAIFLGWLGGYQFCKHKYGLGVLYLFTMGLYGIGWLIDCIHAVSAYLNYDKDDKSLNDSSDDILTTIHTKVVGVTFNCDFPNDEINRQEIISSLNRRDKLSIEYYTYHDRPAYKVYRDKSHIDIGNLKSELSSKIYSKYRNNRLEIISFEVTGGFSYYNDDNYDKEKIANYGCNIEIAIYK